MFHFIALGYEGLVAQITAQTDWAVCSELTEEYYLYDSNIFYVSFGGILRLGNLRMSERVTREMGRNLVLTGPTM